MSFQDGHSSENGVCDLLGLDSVQNGTNFSDDSSGFGGITGDLLGEIDFNVNLRKDDEVDEQEQNVTVDEDANQLIDISDTQNSVEFEVESHDSQAQSHQQNLVELESQDVGAHFESEQIEIGSAHYDDSSESERRRNLAEFEAKPAEFDDYDDDDTQEFEIQGADYNAVEEEDREAHRDNVAETHRGFEPQEFEIAGAQYQEEFESDEPEGYDIGYTEDLVSFEIGDVNYRHPTEQPEAVRRAEPEVDDISDDLSHEYDAEPHDIGHHVTETSTDPISDASREQTRDLNIPQQSSLDLQNLDDEIPFVDTTPNDDDSYLDRFVTSEEDVVEDDVKEAVESDEYEPVEDSEEVTDKSEDVQNVVQLEDVQEVDEEDEVLTESETEENMSTPAFTPGTTESKEVFDLPDGGRKEVITTTVTAADGSKKITKTTRTFQAERQQAQQIEAQPQPQSQMVNQDAGQPAQFTPGTSESKEVFDLPDGGKKEVTTTTVTAADGSKKITKTTKILAQQVQAQQVQAQPQPQSQLVNADVQQQEEVQVQQVQQQQQAQPQQQPRQRQRPPQEVSIA